MSTPDTSPHPADGIPSAPDSALQFAADIPLAQADTSTGQVEDSAEYIRPATIETDAPSRLVEEIPLAETDTSTDSAEGIPVTEANTSTGSVEGTHSATAEMDTPSHLDESAEDVRPAAAEISVAPVENKLEKQRGRPFEPGRSGNPNGRPRGSRNHVTKATEALHEHSEALVAKAVAMALAGDSSMLRALVSSIIPRTRDRTVEFDLPAIETAADACAASAAVLRACSRGELTPNEATEFMALISSHVSKIEVAEIETRLAALEKRQEPLAGLYKRKQ
jgi:hypothetical protein